VIRAAGSGKPAMALRTRGEQLSMVDQESGTYRPRRAFIEPDIEPALPERPAQPSRNGNGRAPKGVLRQAQHANPPGHE
jgi:hypothetical protein